MWRPRAVVLAVAAVLAGTAGCTPAGDPAPVAATRAEIAAPADGLEFRWLQDSDGNVVPDFLERELGSDPLADDCWDPTCGAVPGLDLRTGRAVQENVVLVMDASRFPVADDVRDALTRYALGALPDRRLGLLVAGSAASGDPCATTDLSLPPGDLTADSAAAVPSFEPGGAVALDAALRDAAGLLPPAVEGEVLNRVVLVAGGVDTCGGDVVAAAAALRSSPAAATVDVVALGPVDPAGTEALRLAAATTGGTHQTVASTAGLSTWATDRLFDLQRRLLEASGCVYRAALGGSACADDLAFRAASALRLEAADGGGGPRRRAALADLADAVERHARGDLDARQASASARADELQAQVEQIQRTYRERFGGAPLPPRPRVLMPAPVGARARPAAAPPRGCRAPALPLAVPRGPRA